MKHLIIFYESCGYRCLNFFLSMHNIYFSKRQCRKKELSLLDIKEYLLKYNYQVFALKTDNLFDKSLLHLQKKNQGHYVFLIKKFAKWSYVYDPGKLFPLGFVSNKRLNYLKSGYMLLVF